jgi:predicted metal-dependent hydrolase
MPAPITINKIIHSTRRTIALIILSDGTLTVRAPLKLSGKRIQEFAENHADWIRKKQAQVQASPPPPKKNYATGESFLFLGKEYPLTIVAFQHPALTFQDDRFYLTSAYRPRAREAFIHWYKVQARKLISERVSFHSRKDALAYQKIRISSARTRWGSCSARGTLSFTWRLVLAPLEVIDYVVVHELIHTQIRNHSPIFWQRVAEIMPDYKRHVYWLKKNGRFLSLDCN